MDYVDKKQINGLLMLIDFEKAFDSVSWNFMYKVLNYLGFNDKFIKWIKLINTHICATVLQSGFTSTFLQIGKGCKQGDPIAPYLFITCAFVLYILIMMDKNVKGITIEGNEYKITQYADDTTLILDGSENSLQTSLNILEIFGNMSGLKMNTSKTKVVWIGRKKHSKNKLCENYHLEWGMKEFTLLGIQFTVDIINMPDTNYRTALMKIRETIKKWGNRHLTALGKVTIVKTLLLSKLNHLFLSLPSPNTET